MKNPLKPLEEVLDMLRDYGFNVVAVVSKYDEKDAEFHTYVRTKEDPALPLDHVVLDAVREITTEWSNATHKGQLVWKE